MRSLLVLLVFASFGAIGLPSFCSAQQACAPAQIAAAIRQESAARRQLKSIAVSIDDPQVSAASDSALGRWKNSLAQATEAVFRCADVHATPESLQTRLATALHANSGGTEDGGVVTKDGKNVGSYGADLTVQVVSLFNTPPYVAVDFRYSLECGDDHLLLVFKADRSGSQPAPNVSAEASSDPQLKAPSRSSATASWTEVLRWGAPHYTTVGDAYGDFMLLAPLSDLSSSSDLVKPRRERFAVVHGEPRCPAVPSDDASPSAPSAADAGRFGLDVLEVSADAAQPHVVWHLEQPYTRGQVPRLATTEDTLSLDFRNPDASRTVNAGTGAKPAPASPAASYRYRIDADNRVHALSAAASTPSSEPATGRSPQ